MAATSACQAAGKSVSGSVSGSASDSAFTFTLTWRPLLLFATAALLSACGGNDPRPDPDAAQLSAAEAGAGAPAPTGDVAADGVRWLNFRRAQAGMPALRRDPQLDLAAERHAHYQQLNDVVTHAEDSSKADFVAATASERLRAAGFPLLTMAFADGEVIAANGVPDGFAAVEGLLGAIYHRYVVLEPIFNAVGAGAAHRSGSFHWLTMNLVGIKGSTGIAKGSIAVWPLPSQTKVRTNFFSDQETPDPVPQVDEVGYPVSVHANLNTVLQVDRFALSDPDGQSVEVRQLDAAADRDTPSSAAAIIPLQPLRAGTTYSVSFAGRVDGQAVERRWQFTTR